MCVLYNGFVHLHLFASVLFMHLVSCNCRCNHNLDIISCGTYMLRLDFISMIICLQAICGLLQHIHGFELLYTLAMCVCIYIFAEVRNRDLDPLYVKLFYCLPAALINESHIFPYCFIACNCLSCFLCIHWCAGGHCQRS